MKHAEKSALVRGELRHRQASGASSFDGNAGETGHLPVASR
jgi:hypothetical protein